MWVDKGGLYHATAPDEQSPYGRKKNANDKKRGQNSLGGENGLPGLESLLFESSICGLVNFS